MKRMIRLACAAAFVILLLSGCARESGRETPSPSASLTALQYEIDNIDLVIVDLYPFEQTVASGAPEADIIEKIDIGGISLIRAAAKNFNDVVIVPSKAEYGVLLDILNKQGAETTKAQRREFATRAFGVSAHYDTAINAWFKK